MLLLLPGLIAFAAAVAAARLFGPLVRLTSRVVDRSVGARLAAVTLGRGPGAAAVTVAFLTLAFALALLAEGYRATLVRAEGDQASFAVPLDFVVREDLKSLVPVLDAAPLERYAALAGSAGAVPVLRVRASAGNAEGISGFTVLGLPAEQISRLHGWREGFADRSRASRLCGGAVARDRRPGNPPRPEAPVEAGPGLLSLRATIATAAGRYRSLDLGALAARSATRIDRALPRSLQGGTLVALELVPHGSSTAGPTPVDRLPGGWGSRGCRRPGGSARGVSRRGRSPTASSSATGSRSRATLACGPGRRRTHPRRLCS